MPEHVAPAVTVEQHRVMAKKGIKVRADGKFGFKKRCAREDCFSRVDGRCYCAPTLEEALVQVEQRSAYYCSRRCGMTVDGEWNANAWEYLQGLAQPENAGYHTVFEAALFGLVQKTIGHSDAAPPARAWWAELDHRLAEAVLDVYGREMDEWDPSDRDDDGECACDIDGG